MKRNSIKFLGAMALSSMLLASCTTSDEDLAPDASTGLAYTPKSITVGVGDVAKTTVSSSRKSYEYYYVKTAPKSSIATANVDSIDLIITGVGVGTTEVEIKGSNDQVVIVPIEVVPQNWNYSSGFIKASYSGSTKTMSSSISARDSAFYFSMKANYSSTSTSIELKSNRIGSTGTFVIASGNLTYKSGGKTYTNNGGFNDRIKITKWSKANMEGTWSADVYEVGNTSNKVTIRSGTFDLN